MVEARFPMPSSSSSITRGEGDAGLKETGDICGFGVLQDNAGEFFEDEYRLLKVGTLKLGAAGEGVRCCGVVYFETVCDGRGAVGDAVDSRPPLFGHVNCCAEVLISP